MSNVMSGKERKRKSRILSTISVLSLMLGATAAIMFTIAIDSVLSQRSGQLWLAACCALLCGQAILEAFYSRLYPKVFSLRLSEIVCSYLDYAPPSLEATRITQIFDNDLKQCIHYETRTRPAFLTNIPFILAFFLIILYHSPILAGLVLLLSAVEITLPYLFDGLFSKNYSKTAKLEEHIESFYYTVFSNIKKCWFLTPGYLSARLRGWNRVYSSVGIKSERAVAVYNDLVQIVSFFAQFGLYAVGICLIYVSQNSFAEIVSLVYLGSKVMSMISEEANMRKDKPSYEVSKERIHEVVEVAPHAQQRISSFDSISFQEFYSPYVGKRISFCIRPGELLILRGKNGSGKSTIAKAMMNFSTEYQGYICIDEEDVRNLNMQKLIYYVPQDAVHISMSARELLENSSSDFQLEGLNLLSFPKKLLDESIDSMSGGEQKKLLLTCAFLSDKPILILDEPEASLDQESRNRLCHAIVHYRKTVLLITNSTVFDSLSHKEVSI